MGGHGPVCPPPPLCAPLSVTRCGAARTGAVLMVAASLAPRGRIRQQPSRLRCRPCDLVILFATIANELKREITALPSAAIFQRHSISPGSGTHRPVHALPRRAYRESLTSPSCAKSPICMPLIFHRRALPEPCECHIISASPRRRVRTAATAADRNGCGIFSTVRAR